MVSYLNIFEKLIRRSAGLGESLHYLTGQRLRRTGHLRLEAGEFTQLRNYSQKLAEKAHTHDPISLATIYQIFGQLTGCSLEQQKAAMEAELLIEEQHLSALPSGRETLRRLRDSATGIVFVSDSYLPEHWEYHQLVKHDFWSEGDQLIKAKPRSSPNFDLSGSHEYTSRFEQILINFTSKSNSLSGHVAEAAKRVRLTSNHHCGTNFDCLSEMCAGVGAPILTAYVAWILHDAKARGIRVLYFLSRDGWQLHNLAIQIVRRLKLSMELRYFCVSRQIIRLASIEPQAVKLPDWVSNPNGGISVTSCLTRIGLDPMDFCESLSSLGLSKEKWNTILSREEFNCLLQFLRLPEVVQAAVNAAGLMRTKLRIYIEQQQLNDSKEKAIVDIGWRGSTFASILSHISDSQKENIHCYLFAFLNQTYPGPEGIRIHPYYHDQRCDGSVKSAACLVTLLESFCTTLQGTLLDYSEQEGVITPRFREIVPDRVISHKVEVNNAIQHDYVNEICAEVIDGSINQRIFIPLWEKILHSLWCEASAAEMAELACHRQEIDQAGFIAVPLAEPYRWSEILLWAIVWRPLSSGVTEWPHGRKMLSTNLQRSVVDLITKIHSIGKRLPIIRTLPSRVELIKTSSRRGLKRLSPQDIFGL